MATAFVIPTNKQSQQREAELLIRAFGLSGLKSSIFQYTINSGKTTFPVADKEKNYSVFDSVVKDEPINLEAGIRELGISLNNPVFSTLDIIGANFNKGGINLSYPTLRIRTVLFTVNQPKNIIKTAIQGRDGTVKEYIADGDYEVNIKGVITGNNGVNPKDDVLALFKALSNPNALEISSPYLQIFNIHNVVVENYNLPQQQGGYAYQIFEINALSDEPIELTLR